MSSVYARILIRQKSAAESPISKYPQLMLEERVVWNEPQQHELMSLSMLWHWLNVQIEKERNRNSSVCKSADKILKEIENLLPKKRYVQLELFEF